MTEADAEKEWDYPESPRANLSIEHLESAEAWASAIHNICSHERRMCEEGYFDLSISITL